MAKLEPGGLVPPVFLVAVMSMDIVVAVVVVVAVVSVNECGTTAFENDNDEDGHSVDKEG